MKILLLSNDIRLSEEQSITLFNLISKTSKHIEWISFAHYYSMKHPDFGNIVELNLEKMNGHGKLPIYPFNNIDTINSPKLFTEVVDKTKPDIIMISNNDLTEYDWLFTLDVNIDILNNTPVIVYNSWLDYPLVYGFKPYYKFADKLLAMNYVSYNNAKSIMGKREFNKKVKYLPPSIDTKIYNGQSIDSDLTNMFKGTSKYIVIADGHTRNLETFINFIQYIGYKIRKQIKLILLDTNQQLADYVKYNLLDKVTVMPITKQLTDKDMNYLFSMSDLYIDNKPLNDLSYNTLRAISCSTPVVVNYTGSNIDYITDYNKFSALSNDKPYIQMVKSTNKSFIIESKKLAMQSMYKNQIVYSNITDDDIFVEKMLEIYSENKKNGQLRAKAIQYFDIDVITKKFIDIVTNLNKEDNISKNVNLPLKIKNTFKGIKNIKTDKFI